MTPGALHTQTYSDSDLLKALTEYLHAQNKGEWTGAAKIGMGDFKDRGLWSMNNPESIDSMQQAFDILDSVYFNGYLTKHLVTSMDERPIDKPTQRGSASINIPHSGKQLLADQGGFYCLIKVHPIRDATVAPHIRAQTYQSELIHEMLHAYFEIYRCRCRLGCKDAGRRWRGHTVQWFEAAQAIINSRANHRTTPVASRDGPLIFKLEIRFDRIMAKALLIDKANPKPSNAEYTRMGVSRRAVESIVISEQKEKRDAVKREKLEKDRKEKRERERERQREKERREETKEREKEKEKAEPKTRHRDAEKSRRHGPDSGRHGGHSRR